MQRESYCGFVKITEDMYCQGKTQVFEMTVVHKHPSHEIFKKLELEENTVYKVIVKTSSVNVPHYSILHTGFGNGAYCYVWNNSYDNSVPLDKCYAVAVVDKLCKMKE